jgi:hypothetical protein
MFSLFFCSPQSLPAAHQRSGGRGLRRALFPAETQVFLRPRRFSAPRGVAAGNRPSSSFRSRLPSASRTEGSLRAGECLAGSSSSSLLLSFPSSILLSPKVWAKLLASIRYSCLQTLPPLPPHHPFNYPPYGPYGGALYGYVGGSQAEQASLHLSVGSLAEAEQRAMTPAMVNTTTFSLFFFPSKKCFRGFATPFFLPCFSLKRQKTQRAVS